MKKSVYCIYNEILLNTPYTLVKPGNTLLYSQLPNVYGVAYIDEKLSVYHNDKNGKRDYDIPYDDANKAFRYIRKEYKDYISQHTNDDGSLGILTDIPNSVSFSIMGEPKGKDRPRFYRGHAITSTNTKIYEASVKEAWNMLNYKPYAEKVPVKVSIIGYFNIPESKKKIKEGDYYTNKIDCDNLAKVVLDALNGYAFYDDAQIVSLSVEKYYSKTPRVEVRLKRLDKEK